MAAKQHKSAKDTDKSKTRNSPMPIVQEFFGSGTKIVIDVDSSVHTSRDTREPEALRTIRNAMATLLFDFKMMRY